MVCNLLIGTYSDSEDRSQIDKFLQLSEMTPIENNFPFKLQLPTESVNKIMTDNDFIFGNFPSQIKDTID